MKLIFVILLFFCPLTITISPADTLSVYVGLGIHSEKFDCPEVCYGDNELFITEVTWKPTENFAVKGLHISNPSRRERGYGTNAVFFGLDKTWELK